MTIYFIGGDFDAVKIGYSAFEYPHERLTSLQVGNPNELRILALCDGGLAEERELHRRFAAYAIRSEWFRRCPELNRLIVEHSNFEVPRSGKLRSWKLHPSRKRMSNYPAVTSARAA